jgi:hypothetical protein
MCWARRIIMTAAVALAVTGIAPLVLGGYQRDQRRAELCPASHVHARAI